MKWVTIVYFVLFTPVVIYPFYKIVDVRMINVVFTGCNCL